MADRFATDVEGYEALTDDELTSSRSTCMACATPTAAALLSVGGSRSTWALPAIGLPQEYRSGSSARIAIGAAVIRFTNPER